MTAPSRLPLFALAVLLALPPQLRAQGRTGSVGIGVEAQAYPSGFITAGRLDLRLGGRTVLSPVAGFNVTDRGNTSHHDDEEGDGPGFGLAVRRGFRADGGGWFVGARADLWFLSIDTRSDDIVATVDVTVLQPTGRAGYAWLLSGGRLQLEAGAALGAEVNLDKTTPRVSQGAILLGGVALLYRM